MTTNKQIPLDVAASRAHSTTLNLLMHIKRGLLPAAEVQGQWLISEADLDAFITDNRKADPAELCVHNHCAKTCGSCAED